MLKNVQMANAVRLITVQTENGLSAQSKRKYKIIYYNTILHKDLFTGLREIDKYRKINPLVLLFQ